MDHYSAPDLGWSKCVALLGGHGAHVALVDREGANGWHCQVGMEHIGVTNGQTGTTCMALMDRKLMNGSDGQTGNMQVTDGQGAQVWDRWTDGAHVWHSRTDWDHMHGSDGQTRHQQTDQKQKCGTVGQTRSTYVALMDRQGTHITPTDRRRTHM